MSWSSRRGKSKNLECFEAAAEGEQSACDDKLRQQLVQGGKKRQSTLHELGQDEVPAAPKIILLLLKRRWLMAGAACAGGMQEKGDSRECRGFVLLSRKGGREIARRVAN